MNWVLFFLFLHVAGAIIAFGPTLTFPIIGMMAARDPKYGHFAAELNHAIETRLVIPVAVFVAATGVCLIFAGHFNLTHEPWLGAGIILWIVAMGIATGFLLPNGRKLIEATAGGPPPASAGAAPSGPPPHIAALIKRSQMGGAVLLALLITIIFLMVVKPGG